MGTTLGQPVQTVIIGSLRRLCRWFVEGQARSARVVSRAATTNGVGPLIFVIVADLLLSAYERIKSWVAIS
jgi:hypothetical protein